MSVPTVQIIVADNGASAAAQLPQQNVQVVLGCAISGTNSVPVATTNPSTLASTFTAGPLVEAAGLVCSAGGTVIAIKLPQAAAGTATSVVSTTTNGSTSAITVTLDGTFGAYDDYYVMLKCVTSGTRGTPGIQYQISLDAGRNFGPVLNLGTATTIVISNTGITINVAAGDLKAGDYWRFSTTAPAWDNAGVTAAIAALVASPYALGGWGSMHLVGVSTAATTSNTQTALVNAKAQYVFSRVLTEARDALAPAAWGGSGETSSTWATSLLTAFSSTAADRVVVGAGYYNTPSPYPNTYAGQPSYRRPLTWSDAVRRVLVPPQRRGGRVKDGSLSNIVVDPSTDPGDGFVYYDSRIDPSLDTGRFMTAMTWAKKQGFYICHENLMASSGSQFTDLTLGNVIDVACDIGYAEGVNEISDDLTLTDAGTLVPTDAISLQSVINSALAAGMTNVSMVSSAQATVSQTANVRNTSIIPIQISVNPRGYVNEIVETINLIP